MARRTGALRMFRARGSPSSLNNLKFSLNIFRFRGFSSGQTRRLRVQAASGAGFSEKLV